jgi:predicted nucleic-acid-binding Zn-ribbon protein
MTRRLSKYPLRCAKCGSHDLSEDELEQDGEDIEQHVTCNQCGHEWVNHFEFSFATVEKEDEDE